MEDPLHKKQEPINYTVSPVDYCHPILHPDIKKLDSSSEQYPKDIVQSNEPYIKYEEVQSENQPPASENVHNGPEGSQIKLSGSGVNTMKNEIVDCNYCPFKTLSTCGANLESLQQKCNAVCFYCSMMYRYKMNSLTANVNGNYSCTECSYSTHDAQDIFTHCKEHLDENTCVCSKNVAEVQNFPASNLNPKEAEAHQIFQCSFCSYFAKKPQNLKRHMLTHTGDRPFHCKMCPYRAQDVSSLRVHSKTHTGERPFPCSECSYRASQKSTLRTHFKIHTGEKPFSCSYCSYKSSNQTNLSSHTKTHTGEKPYACTFCSYCSTQSSALKCHVRIHTGEKPYQCSKCPYKAAALGNLKSHSKVHKDV